MRVVLDTNVYLSAILFGGTPERVLDGARAGACDLLLSQAILDEVVGVLRRKFAFTGRQLADVERELRLRTAWVVTSSRLRVVPDDADDDRVLECALDGGADVVVSGDRHLLGLGQFRGVPILSPAEFTQRYL